MRTDSSHVKRLVYYVLCSLCLSYFVNFVLLQFIGFMTFAIPYSFSSGGKSIDITTPVGLPFSYFYNMTGAEGTIGNVVVLSAVLIDFLFWAALAFLFMRYRPKAAETTIGISLLIFIPYVVLYAVTLLNAGVFVPPWTLAFVPLGGSTKTIWLALPWFGFGIKI
jgi:hypothetical protein